MTDTHPTRTQLAVVTVVAGGATCLLTRRNQRETADDDGMLDTAGVRRLYDRIASVYDIATAPTT